MAAQGLRVACTLPYLHACAVGCIRACYGSYPFWFTLLRDWLLRVQHAKLPLRLHLVGDLGSGESLWFQHARA